jgi:putative transposase
MRPTKRQHAALQACLESHRELYNAALQERRDGWRPSRTSIRYGEQSAQLSEIRRMRPDVAVWSFSSQQATLRRLNRAFEGFFRRMRMSEAAPGYPRFKAAERFRNVEWPKDGDGARWVPDRRRVYLQGIGHVKVTAHRQALGRVKTIQVRREGRRWMLILSCDNVAPRMLTMTGSQIGVDVGIARFVTTSDGQHVKNPRFARRAAVQLANAQRRLATKKRGSKNRKAARETVATRHRRVSNVRRDFHHMTARALVESHDVIAVEALNIPNMLRRPKQVPDVEDPARFLPNGAAAKTGLNRSISDAGWGQFVSILRAKAADAGRAVIEVNPRHTSDRCEACGYQDKKNRITQAKFVCGACGHTAQADEHAARNILRAGLARQTAQAV